MASTISAMDAASGLLVCAFVVLLAAPAFGNEAAGDAAFEKGDYRMAAVHFQRALKRDASDSILWQKLALSFERQRRYDEATHAAEAALDIDPTDAESKKLLMRHAYREQRWSEVERYGKELLARDASDVETKALVLVAYERLGKSSEAEELKERYELPES